MHVRQEHAAEVAKAFQKRGVKFSMNWGEIYCQDELVWILIEEDVDATVWVYSTELAKSIPFDELRCEIDSGSSGIHYTGIGRIGKLTIQFDLNPVVMEPAGTDIDGGVWDPRRRCRWCGGDRQRVFYVFDGFSRTFGDGHKPDCPFSEIPL